MSGVIVHEWIESAGGAERVVEQCLEAFPDADLRVLWDDAPGRFRTRSTETWLARSPLRRSKALALPFTLPTWRLLRAEQQYDWMLVSSHLFAHHARFRGASADIAKFVYAHSPARYIWAPELDDRGNSLPARLASPALKKIDRHRAQEATAIAANSSFVRDRIRDTWERDAEVIYPPVDVAHLTTVADWRTRLTADETETLKALPRPFVLGASRFIPYKRLDLVIAAGERAGLPVVIAGRGPEEAALREAAARSSVPVHFVISPSDELLYALFQAASAFVFPAIEDFGIVPVEAQALGTPVVTGPVGGQTESILNGTTGIIADSTDAADLGTAIERAMNLAAFDGPDHASAFSAARFQAEIQDFVGAPAKVDAQRLTIGEQ